MSGTFLVAAFLAACLVASCGSPRHQALAETDQRGALFGAYVSPDTFTDPGRIDALRSYERAVGRRLDVVQTYHKWQAPFPTAIDEYVARQGDILLLSWAGTRSGAIVNGNYDGMIRKRARALERLGTPILLRWRWEMNRPNLQTEVGSPSEYVAAWKHIRSIFDDVGVDNVDWVWCPLASSFDETSPGYYPGDDEVDWLCTDAYTDGPDEPLREVMSPFMHWAASHDKPVVIAEFGTRQGEPGARAAWLDETRAYLTGARNVKAIVYYESANSPGGPWNISDEPSALEAMQDWGRSTWFNPSWGPHRQGRARRPRSGGS